MFASSVPGATNAPSSNFLKPPASNVPSNSSASRPLFGEIGPNRGTSTTTDTTSQPAGFSLSGSTAPNSSLFNVPVTMTQPINQTASQASATPFMQSTQAQAAEAQPGPAAQEQSQTFAPGSQAAFFDDLLQRGRRRHVESSDNNGLQKLPSLQLGLSDISRRVRELGGGPGRGTADAGRNADSKARYVLAGSGVTPETALRELNQLNVPRPDTGSSAPSLPGPTMDTTTYISNLQSQSTLALITESLNRSARDFDAFLQRNVTMDWDAQRQRIYEHFGLVPRNEEARDGDGSGIGGQERQGFGRSTRRGRVGDSRRDPQMSRSVFGVSNHYRSVLGSSVGGSSEQTSLFADIPERSNGVGRDDLDEPLRRNKEGSLAGKVRSLNAARLDGRFFPILRQFAMVESGNGADQAASHIANAYKALVEIIEEDPSAERVTDPNAVRERQFTDEYLDEGVRSAKSMKMKRRILDGSRRHLEQLFMGDLESMVGRFPREARMGGVPTTINKVRAYVTLRASRKEIYQDTSVLQQLDQDYCWVIIFYLLRTGHVKEAVEYVTSNATAFRAIDRNFPTYITSYYQSSDRRLSRDLQARIEGEYQQRTRIAHEHSVDPYRIACYKVVGRCELKKRQLEQIDQGVEDWIWLQLCLAREVNRVDELAGEVLGLGEVRDVVKDIGQRHFGQAQPGETSGDQGIYFFLLVLCGLFEEAVSYLYPFSYVSAVHFAIGLSYYGLLRVSGTPMADSDLLTFNTKQLPQISFGRMIGYYTRDFRSSDVETAVDYLILLCLHADLPGPAGKTQWALCLEALRELVLETREFAKLLGDVRFDGQRMPGAIERRMKLIQAKARGTENDQEEDFLGTLTTQAAVIADDHGRTTDAVLLYHLANDYDKVISVINRALSEAIDVDLGSDPIRLQPLKPAGGTMDERTGQQQQPQQQPSSTLSLTSVDDPAELARNMIGLYNTNALYYNRIRPVNRDVCGILVRMSEAKRQVEGGRWADALDIIESLGILPLRAGGQLKLIRNSAQSFNSQLVSSSSSSSLSSSSLPDLFSSSSSSSSSRPSTQQQQQQRQDGQGQEQAHKILGPDEGEDARSMLARTIGPLLTWSITCCAHQRHLIRSSRFAQDDPTRQAMADDLAVKAKDLMVFAGLIQYHLPTRVFESLARAGAEVDSW